MYIECEIFDNIWNKALRNINEGSLTSVYTWSDGVQQAFISKGSEKNELQNGQKEQAIFFDNADYPIWVEFHSEVTAASFGSSLQSEVGKFSFRNHVLAGILNYKNEIGKSDINLVYRKNNEKKRFTFSFEVLSTKLDYHTHWRSILEDIEKEYRLLSLDFLKRTYHGFALDSQGQTPDIVWWSVFAAEQEKFIKACKLIIERPSSKYQSDITYKRADQLRFIPNTLENEIGEFRTDPHHLYRVEHRVQTNDTQENRFLKFAVNHIADKFNSIKSQIEQRPNVSVSLLSNLELTQQSLNRIRNHSFFRTVGRFKGLNQESLILQKASGYSKVYKLWALLRKGYNLNEGLYKLQTKDIATLYEIWCFIELSHIVKEQIGLDNLEVDNRSRIELNGLFSWELQKGEQSRILFKKDGVELAELVYNPKQTQKENSNIGMKNLVVPTVPQKPDIVLQLTKSDLTKNMKLTYLFDAKYRIEGEVANVDTPPDDAINQMHRYRDAIYYKENKNASLKKEVIGGYILFPGDGESVDVQASKFYKTIKEVNIGAFPLRPKDTHNRALLEEFVRNLLDKKSVDIIDEVIPQKGTFVDANHHVLIANIGNIGQFSQEGGSSQFKVRVLNLSFSSLQHLHYFIPYEVNQEMLELYEITDIRLETDRYGTEDDVYVIFDLRFSREYGNNAIIKFPDNKIYLIKTFAELDTLLASAPQNSTASLLDPYNQ